MTKFEINQKLEVFGLTDAHEVAFNGEIVILVALPGYNILFPASYGVLAKDGIVYATPAANLRPYPPAILGGRGDLDTVSSWEAFDTATGLNSSKFRLDNA